MKIHYDYNKNDRRKATCGKKTVRASFDCGDRRCYGGQLGSCIRIIEADALYIEADRRER